MNQPQNCEASYRSNTWMGRTRTDGPNEFEPSKFDCIVFLAMNLTIISDPDEMPSSGVSHLGLQCMHL